MKILVLILAPIGDTLFNTPALKALRNGFPAAEIDVIASTVNKDIILGNRNIDELIVVKNKGRLFLELKELRNRSYYLAIGLSSTGSYLTLLINAEQRVGFKSDELGCIYDYPAPDNRKIHAVDYCLELVKSVGGIPDEHPRMEISFSDEERRRASRLRTEMFNSHLPLLAIHPGGNYFSLKRWPAEKYKELIKLIDYELNVQLVIIGGKDDRELAKNIIDNNYDYQQIPAILAGELNLKETAALLELTDLFIGNDSAPQHLAAAVGIPVIALFGPTNSANYYPYGTEHKLIRTEMSCSPCFNWLGDLKQYLPEYLPEWASKCKGACMTSIEVKDVLKAVKPELATKKRINKVLF